MHIFNLKICIFKLEIVFSCLPETSVPAVAFFFLLLLSDKNIANE